MRELAGLATPIDLNYSGCRSPFKRQYRCRLAKSGQTMVKKEPAARARPRCKTFRLSEEGATPASWDSDLA